MRTVYLVEERPNPSTDRFVLPAISEEDFCIRRLGFDTVPTRAALGGADVIFVRYVPPAWVHALSGREIPLHRLVIFIDDDVFDLSASGSLPWRYRWKLFRLAGRRLRWLRRRGAELWVGSTHLQEKYSSWSPRLLEPSPIPAECTATRVFYHGSASHQREHAWVFALMRRVLAADPGICFEVIANGRSARRYRRLPRTWVVAPMGWTSYRRFMATPGRHIGLAPMLPSAFNAARSHTKFFDITETGAVGIYARGNAFDKVVEHEHDGLLLPTATTRWEAAIRELARDHGRLERMATQAALKVAALGQP